MHVFVSYSRDDTACVDQVVQALENNDYQVWKDTQSIPPGTPSWIKAIQKGIQDALAFIVVWSVNASNSEWVEREISYALFHKSKIFVIRIDHTSMPLALFTHQPLETSDCIDIALRLVPYLPAITESKLSRIKILLGSSDPAEREEAIRLAAALAETQENCELLIEVFASFDGVLSSDVVVEARKLLDKCINVTNMYRDNLRARCSFCSTISEYSKKEICQDHRVVFMRGQRAIMLTCPKCHNDFIVEFDCEEKHVK